MTGSSVTRSRDRAAVVGPRLRGERVGVHGFVDGPVLVAGGLQHEDVVDVVVRVEAAASAAA